MSNTIFNAKQMDLLEQNPNVNKVSDRSITYNPDFKIQAVKLNLNGKSPQQIFIDHGFDLKVIGGDKEETLRPCEKYEIIERTMRTYQLKGMIIPFMSLSWCEQEWLL